MEDIQELNRKSNIPFVIYHYTSLTTLDAILLNKTLRLSDITKSNDSQEITWIKNYIPDCFSAAYNSSKANFLTQMIDEGMFEKTVEQFTDNWFDLSKNRYSYYVCCFSTERDLLSQWRGYADDGNGVCIGFDSSAIKHLISGFNDNSKNDAAIDLKKIDYNRPSQKKSVRSVADRLIRDLKKRLKENPAVGQKQAEQLLQDKMEDAFKELFQLAIAMKNPFFKEEKEIRLCYLVDNKTIVDSEISYQEPYVNGETLMLGNRNEGNRINSLATLEPFHFFVKGNSISSYVDLCFKGYIVNQQNNLKMQNLIKSIWIGPKCNIASGELQRMLRQRHFPKVKVEISEGSYR